MKEHGKNNKDVAPLFEQKPNRSGLPQGTGMVLLVAILISVLVHLLSGIQLPYGGSGRLKNLFDTDKDKIKIRIVETPKEEPLKILETPQEKTEKPTLPTRLGQVDHQTEKETKIKKQIEQTKALDPGVVGKQNGKQQQQVAQEKQTSPSKAVVTSPSGTISIKQNPKRKAYESFLPTAASDLVGQLKAGYQDFIDDELEEGDRIDINTTEYRYIGYMTGMRKAIELVWNYPFEASSRGLQGEVGLEFAIHKDGKATRIRIIRSSGYVVLDDAIVQAIKLASPFSPLPDGMDKNRLIITGSFRYVLSAYGGH